MPTACYAELASQVSITSWAGAVQASKPLPEKVPGDGPARADAEPVKEAVSVVTANKPAVTAAKIGRGLRNRARPAMFMATSALDVLRLTQATKQFTTGPSQDARPTRGPCPTCELR